MQAPNAFHVSNNRDITTFDSLEIRMIQVCEMSEAQSATSSGYQEQYMPSGYADDIFFWIRNRL